MCWSHSRRCAIRRPPIARSGLLCAALLVVLAEPCTSGRAVDLAEATIVVPPQHSPRAAKAVAMLVDEVAQRTQLRWPVVTSWPADAKAVIAVGRAADLPALAGPYAAQLAADARALGAEGYRVRVHRGLGPPAVFVVGNDDRGVLFGVGRLLRALDWGPRRAAIADDFALATAPRYALRGHQLGYRPKTNSYDAWDLPQWEQYLRDLAVFGTNAIELVPPRTDDAATSPHFQRPPLEMMRGMSRLADEYGLDVWVWYPALDADYSDPATVARALDEWEGVLAGLPRLDAVFVPGGDPGHTPPAHLLPLLEQVVGRVRRAHPAVEMWVSPQGFNRQWLDEFLQTLSRDEPSWLSGVVFGPQVRIGLPELRAQLPKRYPIRHYPDITHSRQCQYPVPDWDVAYAVTAGRECINPRPRDQATIFRQLQPYTIGFLTYSEGCNDDVNKFIWSGLGWDPQADVVDLLRQYAGYFIGSDYRDGFAQGLLSLEQNWRGPLAANAHVETTLGQFQSLERAAPPPVQANWRFQQALYRAYYDAYTHRRLLHETQLEAQALDVLRAAGERGALAAVDEAQAVLARAETQPVARDWHARIFALAEALFRSIGLQSSVARYQAIAVDRGATLDTLDYPLNNRRWLLERFGELQKLPDEPSRLAAIDRIVQWTNPGPGGFYDDLGNSARQPHLVVGPGFDRDPGCYASARAGFAEWNDDDDDEDRPPGALRVSWMDHAESLYDSPLEMRYAGLDRRPTYKLRVVYGGDAPDRQIRLVAGDDVEVHPLLNKPRDFGPLEFSLPLAAMQTGELRLRWYREAGLGRNGRGCQVSEVWLIRQPPADAR